jgi:hypothetical protein
MIETDGVQPDAYIEFRLSGHVTGHDYDEVLIPALEAAIEKYPRLRMLWLFDHDFEGYQLDAAWDDTKVGLRHWNVFDRVAVASDVAWVRQVIRAAGFVINCPVRLFDVDEADEARRWLRESLGSIHLHFDDEKRQMTVQLLGKLEPSAYEGVSDEIDGFLAPLDDVKLLLDMREFDGWQGLGALHEHLTLVREHRHIPKRVALVGHAGWQKLAIKIVARFVHAEGKFFDRDIEAAQRWLDAGD